AAALITAYGSVDALLTALDNDKQSAAVLTTSVRRKLEAARDYVARAKPVVAVARDAKLPAFDDRLPSGPRDPETLVTLSSRWNLDSPLNRLLQALAERSPASAT
ncbi:MAG: flap endonuclease, partial [Mycobacteriales bacterium]